MIRVNAGPYEMVADFYVYTIFKARDIVVGYIALESNLERGIVEGSFRKGVFY